MARYIIYSLYNTYKLSDNTQDTASNICTNAFFSYLRAIGNVYKTYYSGFYGVLIN